MKKLKYFLAVCLVAIISTGCVKFNANIDIKKDKSMDFSIIYAFDKSLMGENSSLKEEDFDELKKDGYSIEKYKEGNFEGFKITKKIKNIDEVSTDKDVEFNLSKMMEENDKYMFKVVKNGDKSTYYAKFKFDSNDGGLNDDNTNESGQALPDENDETLTTTETDDATGENNDVTSNNSLDLSSLTSSMDLSVNVTLPNSAISSNATTKENNDKKLSWKLNASGSQTIEFAFELGANEGSNMLLYIGIGAGVLLLIAIVVIVMLSSKKKKTAVVSPVEEVPVKKEEIKENE